MNEKILNRDHILSLKEVKSNKGTVPSFDHQSAKHHSGSYSTRGRFSAPWTIALLLIIFSTILSATENQSFHTLTGKITLDGKESVYPLTVSIFVEKDQFPGSPAYRVMTDPKGIFSVSLQEKDTLVLQISGNEGDGRVLVAPEDQTADTLRMTYPVMEEIVLLHNNDVHFDLNHPDLFLEKVNEYRQLYDDVFLLSAGDIFVRHAHRWKVNGVLREDISWYAQRTAEMVETMNTMQYDAMTLGNHEFDYKEEHTSRALAKADFPLLAANVDFPEGILPPADDFIALETHTWREIGVLGLSVGVKKEGIERQDIFETAKSFSWMEEETDVFVALTHIGLRNDKALAKAFPALDVIIGGHSHDLLEESLMVNDVLVSMAGGNPHEVSDDHPVYLGIITLQLLNGKIINKAGKVIRIVAE